jgi:RNA-binding protein 39
VKEECGKYGPVAHIWVDKASKGFIYVKFGTASAASVAQAALHGRFFAGKQVLSGMVAIWDQVYYL